MLSDINKQISTIKVDDETKDAILQLIDLKTDNDMDKVINKIDIFGNKIDNINENVKKDINKLYWFIGAGMVILTTAITILTIVISLKK